MRNELIKGWLRARSVARGLPGPVAELGGWRVETGLPYELRRYVFARPEEGLRVLAETIREPRVFLKLCGSEDEMRPLLTERWRFDEPRFVMTGDAFHAMPRRLAAGYSLQLYRNGPTVSARILGSRGELAASGHAAEVDGVFIYDQIETAPVHQRRGLASYLMQALRSTRKSPEASQILVATAAGRALYESLGWDTRSPYTTAHVVDL